MIPQSYTASHYSSGMGGVDTMDIALADYRLLIKGEKVVPASSCKCSKHCSGLQLENFLTMWK